MLSIVDRHVIARESNVVRVDFRRDPIRRRRTFLVLLACA